MTSRHIVLALVCLTLLASFALRLVSLGYPGEYVFDEVYYAKDAKTILKGNLGPVKDLPWEPGAEVSWPHPEMGKLALAAGVALVGDRSWGWRIVPALAGTILLALVYPLARRLRLPRAWALAALLLAASDTLLLAQSRIATLDIFVAVWTVLCIYLALVYVQGGRRWWWLLACGLAGGMAFGTKWSGALALAAAVAILLITRRSRPGRPFADRVVDFFEAVPLPVLCLAVLPAAIYFASYGLYFAHGHSLAEWRDLQSQMWQFNMNLNADHPYASRAYTWIFDVRPVWYFYQGEPKVRGITAMGNPLLWWASVPAVMALFGVAWARRRRRRARDDASRREWWALVATVILEVVGWTKVLAAWLHAGRSWSDLPRTDRVIFAVVVVVLVAALARIVLRSDPRLVLPPLLVLLLYLPWLGTSRTSFLYYMTPVVPFMAICVALSLALLAGPALTRCRAPAAAFVAGAVVMALAWHPIAGAARAVFWSAPLHVSRGAGVATASLAIGLLLAAAVVSLVLPRLRAAWLYLTWAYVGVVAGTAWVFLPIVLARAISNDHFYRLMWFSSWI